MDYRYTPRGGKNPQNGEFGQSGGGPTPCLARPEAYWKPENARFAGRAVVWSMGAGFVTLPSTLSPWHGVRTLVYKSHR